MNFEMRERLVAQQLIERGSIGLFEVLLKLKGMVLNQQYTIRWLYAVGGQCVLYMVEQPNGQMAIAKLALLPYHRAAYMSIKNIHLARKRLKSESEFLQRFHDTILPEFNELIYDENPLHPKVLRQQITEPEPYLIMEWIQGSTLLELAQLIHSSHKPDYEAFEHVIWHIILAATNFSLRIQENGYLYADFSPHNFMLTNEPTKPIRILDAGSLVPLQSDPALPPPLTPVYVPPAYYDAYKRGTPLWPTTSYATYTLGKVLWESLTNLQPYPAEDPDLDEPHLKYYSEELQKFIAALIQGQYTNFEQLKQAVEPIVQAYKKPLAEQLASLQTAAKKPVVPTSLVKQPSAIGLRNIHKGDRASRTQSNQTQTVKIIRHSLSGEYLAIARGKKIELWNTQTLRQVRSFRSPHTTPVVSIDFNGSGQYLASGSAEGIICLWHTDSDEAIWQSEVKEFSGQVAINTQGNLLAVGTKWSAATFYPQRTLSNGRSFDGFVDKGTHVAIGKHLPVLAVGGLWGMRLWDLDTEREIGKDRFKVDNNSFIHHIAFGNKDQTVAALCTTLDTPTNRSIMVWNTTSCELLWQIKLPQLLISDLRLSSEGRLILAGATNSHLLLWDEEQKKEIAHLTKAECGPIATLDFALKDQAFITAAPSGKINIYHLDAQRTQSNVL